MGTVLGGTDLHHSVLEAGRDGELVRLYVEDEVGSDGLGEVLQGQTRSQRLAFKTPSLPCIYSQVS